MQFNLKPDEYIAIALSAMEDQALADGQQPFAEFSNAQDAVKFAAALAIKSLIEMSGFTEPVAFDMVMGSGAYDEIMGEGDNE